MKEDEEIMGVVKEVFYGSSLECLEELAEEDTQGDQVVRIHIRRDRVRRSEDSGVNGDLHD